MCIRPRRKSGFGIARQFMTFVRDAVRQTLMESRPVSGIPVPTSPVVVLSACELATPSPGGQRGVDLPFSEFSAHMQAFTAEPDSGEIGAAVTREQSGEAEGPA